MDLESIISQIQNIMPKYTDVFNDTLDVQEMTCENNVITVKTALKHLLKNNDFVNIIGAYCSNEITNIDLIGNTAIATCLNDHDLTEIWHKTVYITGFNNESLNGEYKLISVNSPKEFAFEIIGRSAEDLSGDLFLQEKRAGYNGRFKISVTDDYTFSFPTEYNLPSPAFGEIKICKNIRFTGCVDVETAIKAYTEQTLNNYWGFVVVENGIGNKNKQNSVDSVYRYDSGQAFKQEIIEQFSIYIFVPTIQSKAARSEQDFIRKYIRKYLFKCLLGIRFDSGFSGSETSGVTYVSDNIFDYNSSFYVHRFLFETISTVTGKDIVEPDDTFAFRNFEINYQNQQSNVILNIKGETDY